MTSMKAADSAVSYCYIDTCRCLSMMLFIMAINMKLIYCAIYFDLKTVVLLKKLEFFLVIICVEKN